MRGLSSDLEEYNFYKSQGVEDSKLEEYFNITIDSGTGSKIIYLEEKMRKGILGYKKGEDNLISIKYYLPN